MAGPAPWPPPALPPLTACCSRCMSICCMVPGSMAIEVPLGKREIHEVGSELGTGRARGRIIRSHVRVIARKLPLILLAEGTGNIRCRRRDVRARIALQLLILADRRIAHCELIL